MMMKANDNRKDETMETNIEQSKYEYAMKTMAENLDMFKHLKTSFEQGDEDAAPDESDLMIAAAMGVVLDMAERYYDIVKVNYKQTYGKEYDDGLGGTDREGEGCTCSTTGTSVPEAGCERGSDTGTEGAESTGLGGTDGQGDEHGSGDRDGGDEDTRQ